MPLKLLPLQHLTGVIYAAVRRIWLPSANDITRGARIHLNSACRSSWRPPLLDKDLADVDADAVVMIRPLCSVAARS